MIKKKMENIAIVFFVTILICTGMLQSVQEISYAADSSFEAQLTAEGFPESYKAQLRVLHEKHPTWTFKAKKLGYSWDDALAKQYANVNANTVAVSQPDSFKAVKNGTYNFDTHTYLPKDGADWVSASKAAVSFYMDPRNFLKEEGIFMFESFDYDSSYQSESIVKKILNTTALPASASAYYMQAAQQTYNGKTYTISPVYLATKTRIELGSSDFMINGHSFTYGGKNYSGVYNTYNIGASDSADGSAATKGLVFAAGGSDGSGTSFLRPWDSLEKAIKGGALYIAENFMGNNQYTQYYERFNVLNGLSNIGTHQYATSVFNAATMASIMQSNYSDLGILEEAFTFEIPVYENMPSQPCPYPPGSGNNNCYLDDIVISGNGKSLTFTTSFNRFTSSYTVKETVGKATNKLTITTKKNDNGSKITITGNQLINGQNKITVRCKSSSGLVSKYYYIYVTKDNSIDEEPQQPDSIRDGVENTTVDATATQGKGYIQVEWEKSPGYKMDHYEVFKSKKANEFGNTAYYTTADGAKTSYKNTKELVKGTRYYYRVRGVRELDGKTYYSKWSNTLDLTYEAGSDQPSGNENLVTGVEDTTIKASSSQGKGYVQVEWEKSPGYKMDYYEVFRSTKSDSFAEKAFYTTSDGLKTSYRNTKELVKGTRYYYRVRGVRDIDGSTYYSQWSNLAYRTYNGGEDTHSGLVQGVENTTLAVSVSLEKGGIRVTWKKSPGYKVDYYEVFKSKESGNYEKEAYYTTPDGLKLTYKNTKELIKGARYYYKVRGVRNINGKIYYTRWSPETSLIAE